jgi:hypothetical protein
MACDTVLALARAQGQRGVNEEPSLARGVQRHPEVSGATAARHPSEPWNQQRATRETPPTRRPPGDRETGNKRWSLSVFNKNEIIEIRRRSSNNE